jgi:hypothetical protein
MPWYYAGPEAKPVGPVSLEELHARRVNGVVSPETYIIEHTGQSGDPGTWKRYREIFPPAPSLPPVPLLSLPPPLAVVPVQPVAPSQAIPPHPLFPSAASASPQQPVFAPATRPDPYYQIKPTNGWCLWGFVLSLIGLFFTVFACGTGVFLALPAFFICCIALVRVHHNQTQSGRGLAIAGLLVSGFTLLIFLGIFTAFAIPAIKGYEHTVTEQSTNDTE